MSREVRLLVTCEHGGNRIPARYRGLFARRRTMLESHAGHDVGALAVARDLAAALAARLPVRLVYSTTSRLLVDLNRSIGHPRLHGDVVRALDACARRAIVARHYAPYREQVEHTVEAAMANGARVLHVSCHSFTPALDGNTRNADIGLLYDPARETEACLVRAWRTALRRACPGLRVRFNYPYRGTADGLTTSLRRRFPEPGYTGIELEVNQSYPLGDPRAWRALRRHLTGALAEAVRDGAGVEPPGARRSRATAARSGPGSMSARLLWE